MVLAADLEWNFRRKGTGRNIPYKDKFAVQEYTITYVGSPPIELQPLFTVNWVWPSTVFSEPIQTLDPAGSAARPRLQTTQFPAPYQRQGATVADQVSGAVVQPLTR
ncbi:hypothetical protein AGOR_G00146260 [Albula goreensis]|uniref:Uncharacterized protein n=1 Tax=Albula goreensis TaxID=1534307 RepID=A0A8T3D216_9TELE|nr:hypothetical protein AGOR_G00146260 [Albula goreensis]